MNKPGAAILSILFKGEQSFTQAQGILIWV